MAQNSKILGFGPFFQKSTLPERSIEASGPRFDGGTPPIVGVEKTIETGLRPRARRYGSL